MRHDRLSSLDKLCMFSLWCPVGLSLINFGRVVFMGTQELIYTIISAAAVIAAPIIAGIVTLIVQSKQLKRDGRVIDETKAIATDIQPKVNNIDYRTEKQLEKIDVLVAEVDYRKRVEANFPSGLSGRDLIHAGTQKLIDEGAERNLQYQELSLKYQQAQNRIMELNAENSQLRSQVAELRIRLQGCEQDYEWEP